MKYVVTLMAALCASFVCVAQTSPNLKPAQADQMVNEEKILTGILVSLIVWLVTKGSMYLLSRARTQAGILADLELLTKGIRETNDYLNEWMTTLAVGQEINYSARHSADGYQYFYAILVELPKYFSKKIFSRIFRFYKAIEEYDVLLGGFFADVTTWKNEKRKLTAEDISYLARKKDRVIALGTILTKTPISDLEQIPVDYEGKIAPKTIIK